MVEHVVVTGSSGYIGAAVVAHLRSAGHDVVGVDRRPSAMTAVVGDLADVELEPVVSGASAVVHCAALHAPHVGRVPDEDFTAVNVDATRDLLSAAVDGRVPRFVFASTTSVYGRALEADDRAVWVDETLVPEPRDVYDVTKLEAEALVTAHAGPALTTVTLRIGRCFVEPWSTTVVNRLHRGVDLRDVVTAIDRSLTAPVHGHLTVNVAGPRLFEQSDVVGLRRDAEAVLGERAPWVIEAFRLRGWQLPVTLDRVYVSDRARSTLGYEPRYGVRAALDDAPGD